MNASLSKRKKFQRNKWKVFKNDIALYVMLIFPVVIVIIFRYIPMAGTIIAFKDYDFTKGIWGSNFIGFKWFARFLGNKRFISIFRNTLSLSVNSLIFSFPWPIILAISLNEVTNQKFKRSIQTFSYLPYFISTVVVVGIMHQILSPTTGVVNNIITFFGGEAINFITQPKWFKPIYIISGIWSNIGYNSIIYLSALTTINPELYEASFIDGAGRWDKIYHITLPGILPVIIILFLLSLGSLINIGYEKAYLMQNSLNLSSSEIIGTYVYKQGLIDLKYSYSTAVGLFQSMLNFILITVANTISRKIADISLW
jgi:putative aldouronate transport system permease protein